MEIQYIDSGSCGSELVLCEHSELSYPFHNHVSADITGMVLGGSIRLTTGKEAHIYRTGQVFTIPVYVPHRIDAQETYSMLSLCVKRSEVGQMEGKALLMRAFREGKITDAQLGRLLPCLCRPAPPHFKPRDSCMDSLQKQIIDTPENQFSLECMAKAVFLDKTYLIRRFHREYGLTPHQFQIQNRVRKAQRLLRQSHSAAETALAAGFCDQSHFIRQFEKIVGLTPSVYRASCKSLSISAKGGQELGE